MEDTSVVDIPKRPKTLVKDCPNCGESYSTYKSVDKQFCRQECFWEFKKSETRKRKTKQCLVCSKDFIPKHPHSPGLYCSYKCSGVANRKPFVMRKGYRYICDPSRSSHSQGYISEHRMVFEDYTGVVVKKGEAIHHINGDKLDNSINNLMLLSDSAHSKLHAREFARGERGRIRSS